MIIIPRKHYTQPQGRVEVDWNSGLSNGLMFAVVGGSGLNAGTNKPLSWIENPPVRGLGSSGLVDIYNRSGVWVVDHPPWRPLDGEGVSFFSIHVRTGNDTNQQLATAQSDNGVLFRTNDAGLDRFLVHAGGAYRVVQSPTSAVGVPVSLHGSWDRQTLRLFRDGGEIASVAENRSPTSTSSGHIIGGRNATGTVERFFGVMYLTLAFRRGHTSAEAQELSSNPWQIFKADPVRIYSLPSGTIVPTLSGASFAGRIPSVTLSY